MCGIAGVINRSLNGTDDLTRCVPALKLLEHRGPDDTGFLLYSQGAVQLGKEWSPTVRFPEVILLHRRLSIIDLAEGGWQPMASDDRRYYVVYNGEIYNYIELRDELERLGYRFRSRSDTEVLLAAYSHWGVRALSRFTGMFAFAVLDTLERKVFLARDCFGIKPLYYTNGSRGFVFASELKALLALASVNRNVNPQGLYLYLRYGVTDQGGDTLLSEIHQLPAAHYIEVSLDAPSYAPPQRYWTPVTDQDLDISFQEAAKKLRELFLKNVSIHLRSDVPVGAALSGGIDSSCVVMAMRHLDRRLDLHTFSYIADDHAMNEEPWVDIIGEAADSHVHKVQANADDLLSDLDQLTRAQEEPFGSTSIYAQYRIFKKAAEVGVKVMLDGQGADEILGGYRYYMSARLASMIRQNRFQEASKFLRRCSQWPSVDKSWVVFKAADYLLPHSIQAPLRKLIGKDLMPSWMNTAWFNKQGTEGRGLDYTSERDVLKASLFQDLTANSLPHLLRYEDRNSMAFSIESRVPFLTPELVGFILALPEDYIIGKDGASKAIFRQAMRGIVPDCILDRRDKIGFATPERKWLSSLDTWVRRVLTDGAAAGIPALNSHILVREWQDTMSGRKRFDFRLWRIINVMHWTQQFGVQYN